MKILFVLQRTKYVTSYEPALRLLAERGHQIHFTFSMGKSSGGRKRFDTDPVDRLVRDFPATITWDADAPARDAADGWFGIAHGIRVFGDYWRYLHPRYAHAPLLAQRVSERAQRFVEGELPTVLARPLWRVWRWLARHPRAGLSDALLRLARDLERAVPPSGRISDYIARISPDVVLVTPVVDIASDQAEFLKSATSLGIPCGICVHSWDNLTNKGVIRVDADAVFVWNEAQKTEAAELHGVPAQTVIVTGSQKFDPWFARTPSLDAGSFRRKVGLDPEQPYMLYVCSSRFIAGDERRFVERWLEALRREPGLRDVGVLIRPHPENGAMWRDADLARFGNVSIYPPEGAEVAGEEARDEFFDSLHHSAAVVGINTSAMIEAAIVGKAVYTVLDDEFRDSQEGTLHFHYLLHENGGILHVARDLSEHVGQLAEGVHAGDDPGVRVFVESFVRPHGLDQAAAPILADAVEQLAASPAAPSKETPRSRALHALLAPVAALQRRTARKTQLGTVGISDRVVGRQLELELAPLRRTTGTIVIGPWLGDGVEELLYWIPYVRRLVGRLGLDPARLVAVSSGGVGSWYEGICERYVDLEELLEPEQVARALTGWVAERDAARREVVRRLGADDEAAVHGKSLRRLFNGYRAGRTALSIPLEFCDFQLLAARSERRGIAVEAGIAGEGLGDEVVSVGGGATRGEDTIAVAGAQLLLARPGGLAALGVFTGTPTLAVVDPEAEPNEADIDLLGVVAERLGGAFGVVAQEQAAILAAVLPAAERL